MLGVSPDNEHSPSPVSHQYSPLGNYASSPVSPMGSKRSFAQDDVGLNGYPQVSSASQGPNKYRIMSPVEPNFSQIQLNNSYLHHQKSISEDQNLYATASSAYIPPSQNMNYPGSRHTSMPNVHGDALALAMASAGRSSPMNGSPMAESPILLNSNDAANYHQRRHSESMAAANMAAASAGAYSNAYQQPHPMQPIQHPYAQQAPYPQANFYQQQQASQQEQLYNYRTPSPIPPSPVGASSIHSNSPHPPSPLELSLSISTNFGSLSNNNSHQNLPSLFDTTLNMSNNQQPSPCPSSATGINVGSPLVKIETQKPESVTTLPPLVITTTNEDGNEVGFYYAIPPVNLNPGFNDSDLFQDFAMGEDGDTVGEDFVWIENLFDETNAAEEAAAVAAASMAGQVASVTDMALLMQSNSAHAMDMSLTQQQAWSADFGFDLGNDRAGRMAQTLQG
ncbi:hypothetical protein BG004_007909 [Podila humilis]|nr:hypothetical protein BG004_007909 [Podila humilis]